MPKDHSFYEGLGRTLYEGIKTKNETMNTVIFFFFTFILKMLQQYPKIYSIEQRAFLGKEFKQLCQRI